MVSRRSRMFGLLVGLLAVGLVRAADEPARTIKAGAISFKVPGNWKSEQPKSSMRAAQLKVEPVKGEKDAAELVVFAFPNGAGTVEANVARWAAQFADAEGRTPKPKTDKKRGKNVDVTRVEITGRYIAPLFPGSTENVDKPNYRLLGAIVQTETVGYFFKMVGPDKTMSASLQGFDDMVASMEVAKE